MKKCKKDYFGRFAIEDVINPKTKKLIVDKNTMITENIAEKIVEAGIEKLKVRSVLRMPFKTWCMSKMLWYGISKKRQSFNW